MNVEIGTEPAQFPENEYINGIFIAVCLGILCLLHRAKTIERDREGDGESWEGGGEFGAK
jgi:hypothetical protein